MIPVVIKCQSGFRPECRPDGFEFFDLPIYDPDPFTRPKLLAVDQASGPLQVVPPDALRSLLEGKKFGRYEKHFGPVSDEDRARLIAVFKLIECARTDQNKYELEFQGYMLAARQPQCPVHGRRMVLREVPFRHWHCPIAGCLRAQPHESGPPISKGRQQQWRYQPFSVLAQLDEKRVAEQEPVKALSSVLRLIGLVSELIVWQNAKTKALEPGIRVETFSNALLALLFLSLHNSESLAICPCGKRYTRTKTTQIFCTARCAARERKARQRSREKEDTNGPQKTR
jgi:hypothetical protein